MLYAHNYSRVVVYHSCLLCPEALLDVVLILLIQSWSDAEPNWIVATSALRGLLNELVGNQMNSELPESLESIDVETTGTGA